MNFCFIFLRLLVVNLYNNIRPGDTTHDDIQLKFKDYFTNFNRRMKIFIQASRVQQLPCFILQVLMTFHFNLIMHLSLLCPTTPSWGKRTFVGLHPPTYGVILFPTLPLLFSLHFTVPLPQEKKLLPFI